MMINCKKQNLIFLIKIKIEKKSITKNSISKILILSILFVLLINALKNNKIRIKDIYELNRNYISIQKYINYTFPNKLNRKIRFGIYIYRLKGGGIERVTSLLLNFIHEIKKIDILLYQFPHCDEISLLNRLPSLKTIFYRHSSIFYWIQNDLFYIKYTYREYFNSKYIVSLIPLENDFIFLKWGITTSILMDNFITYKYEAVIPSDLTSNNIIMLGRADDIYKRYDIGIQSMEFVIIEIPESKMKIISSLAKTEYLQNLMYNLNMENYIEFVGFIINPEIYFKNSSLHIFPTLTEAFPMALSEIKIYGIPTILLGLDYVTLSEGGTIIIYDESPESIAKESLKIMKNKKYRFKIGREARLSMKRFNNNLLAKKWIKLILSIYNGDAYYRALQNDSIQLSNITALKILNNQVKLIKKRKPIYLNTNVDDFLNFNYLMNFNFIFDDLDDE